MLERKAKITRQQRKKRLVKLAIWIVIGIFFFLVLKNRLQQNKQPIPVVITHVPVTVTTTPLPSPIVTPTPSEDISVGLDAAIQSALVGTQGSYGIVVENLKNKESDYINAHTVYESGSLYKLWGMAAAFEEIQQGKLHENQILTENVAQLNKTFYIDPDSAEKTSGKIKLSIHDALEQMITISDNYAALLLAERLKLSTVTSFLQKNGLSESKVGIKGQSPVTTPADISLFFDKLYTGNLANPKYTDAMISLLKRQRLNEKIPKYIPDGISIAHKTGELDQFTHDAGIIYAPNGDYILVVLSKSDSRDLANERIAEISQAVYNYFNPEN